ncbi:hypothetical protein QQ045_004761 [Rhodiola kirilowii]
MNAMNSIVINAAAISTNGEEDEVPPRRRPNLPRQRESRVQNLLEDYFVEHPIFHQQDFRRRYRMSSNLFNRIKTKLCNNDPFWHQRPDAAGVLVLLPEQKMTGAIRMLAYGSCADQCAEITRMGESTTLECMKKWCTQVVDHYKDRYLRSPNATDLSRLLHRAEQRGFPEAVASYDTWIWHSFIGVSGAQNDLNVLYKSDIFDPLLAGICPQVTYKKQESYRKDVERCFGILQSRWAILRHAGMCHRKSVLKTIMLACIIMHNMIVEEEFVEDEFEETEELDLHNPTSAFTVYDGPTDQYGNRIRHDPIERTQQSQAFSDRLTNLQSAYLHNQLQSDLVKHNWFMETGEQL